MTGCPALIVTEAPADGEITTMVAPDGHLVEVIWSQRLDGPLVEVHAAACACH